MGLKLIITEMGVVIVPTNYLNSMFLNRVELIGIADYLTNKPSEYFKPHYNW